MVPISVVIITKNEEDNIENCLKSVYDWADEIILVDDESNDKTIELARKYTNKIFQRKMDIEGIHRNWAYSKVTNEWVLSLDADESVTPELKDEISNVIKDTDMHVYTIPRRNYIGDYWVKYGGQYPSAQLKLFKKGKFKFEEAEVHPRAFVEGGQKKIATLKGDIIHKSYRDFGHFLSKLNSQTTLEAKKWIRTGKDISFGKAFWRTIDRFPRTYFRKKAHKDGFIGFMVAFFASLYQIMSYAKYWELRNKENKKNNL